MKIFYKEIAGDWGPSFKAPPLTLHLEKIKMKQKMPEKASAVKKLAIPGLFFLYFRLLNTVYNMYSW